MEVLFYEIILIKKGVVGFCVVAVVWPSKGKRLIFNWKAGFRAQLTEIVCCVEVSSSNPGVSRRYFSCLLGLHSSIYLIVSLSFLSM